MTLTNPKSGFGALYHNSNHNFLILTFKISFIFVEVMMGKIFSVHLKLMTPKKKNGKL